MHKYCIYTSRNLHDKLNYYSLKMAFDDHITACAYLLSFVTSGQHCNTTSSNFYANIRFKLSASKEQMAHT